MKKPEGANEPGTLNGTTLFVLFMVRWRGRTLTARFLPADHELSKEQGPTKQPIAKRQHYGARDAQM